MSVTLTQSGPTIFGAVPVGTAFFRIINGKVHYDRHFKHSYIAAYHWGDYGPVWLERGERVWVASSTGIYPDLFPPRKEPTIYANVSSEIVAAFRSTLYCLHPGRYTLWIEWHGDRFQVFATPIIAPTLKCRKVGTGYAH